VTFDSGGISIKPSSGMGSMKGDMAGGAVAIGTTLALAKSRSKVNLLTLIPAVENMPSGSAYRPGDVVRAMNGKTIEIVTTDAEGRLTLADALAYGEKKGARVIVDIATLTGGCVVALGTHIAGVMGNDQALTDRLLEITKSTGEPFWQLPLYEEYRKQIKSEVADLKNSGGRYASTITAGLFLQSFVKNAKWLHIDVAGNELTDKESFYTPAGGTGFGVRTLYELMTNL
jgi:leucyl aminopeptidase